MYISDRPAKAKKIKKESATNCILRNSLNNSGKEISESQKRVKSKTSSHETTQKYTSKNRVSKGKKKKKGKRESLNKEPIDHQKFGLILNSKFGNHDILKNRTQKLSLTSKDIQSEIAVRD